MPVLIFSGAKEEPQQPRWAALPTTPCPQPSVSPPASSSNGTVLLPGMEISSLQLLERSRASAMQHHGQ